MGLKSRVIYAFAKRTRKKIRASAKTAVADQELIFTQLIQQARNTRFGLDHNFSAIHSHLSFTERVAVRDYEGMRGYIDQILAGEENVLWPGRPLYFAKTSGTTSGIKYIPITQDSIPNHIGSARDALFNMAATLQLNDLFAGKMIFLSGSPTLEEKGGIPTGRLSGIVNHWVPGWLRTNQMPSYETNCIEDWETKVDRIAQETLTEDMRLISGIPPWVQMYYERLIDLSGKSTILEIFPNYQLFVYGGVNFEPYRQQLEQLTGGPISSLETFPASEGFFAFQDTTDSADGLLLRTNDGIFFEFVPLQEAGTDSPKRLTLQEVEAGQQYALVISSNAGLWAYDIGDVIEFISVDPYRVKVTGRTKHFISAFGEHVIAKEVEEALRLVLHNHPCRINEFTVAPQVNPPGDAKPYHEWWIEFAEPPSNLAQFAADLDTEMTRQNLYYQDLIAGNILRPLIVRSLPPGSFKAYMQSIGKLGGQNKVPRLSNDRQIADALSPFQRP